MSDETSFMNLLERATNLIESSKEKKFFISRYDYRDAQKDVIYSYNKVTGLKAHLQKELFYLGKYVLTCQINNSTLFVTEQEEFVLLKTEDG